MDELQRRWSRVKEEIEAACRRSGRDPRDVRVVAVTKYVDSDTIRQELDIGLKDIGESRVQEAVPKWEALDGRGTWHFIGHLQRNKVKDAVTRFTYIHSLNRFSLAEAIKRRASRCGPRHGSLHRPSAAEQGEGRGHSIYIYSLP